MHRGKLLTVGCVVTLGLVAVVASIALAAESAKPEMKLPPGWTEADMKAVMEAGTPGKMHALLAKSVGTWQGKSSMWMGADGGEPMVSECTSTVTAIMDGKFFKCEMKGEMPGMGPYNGLGIYGFDNVTGKFVSTWIDNMGTGMMNGDGALSADGKTLTWSYNFTCPITKKLSVMREVETTTGDGNTKTLEMIGPDPKTGKEYKMMRIELTKK
jgi:hypothetical protein